MARLPDYNLAAMDKSNNKKSGSIGAGWINPNGSISITLNVGACLTYNKDVVYTLFLVNPAPEPPAPQGSMQPPHQNYQPAAHNPNQKPAQDFDDDLPF